MVLITKKALASIATAEQFPSPYGDYGSYRHRKFNSIIRCPKRVSVPLRGLWFLSPKKPMKGLIPKKKVSVPLRGLWFLSIGIARRTLAGYEAFPSPYGDCGSYPEYRNTSRYRHC